MEVPNDSSEMESFQPGVVTGNCRNDAKCESQGANQMSEIPLGGAQAGAKTEPKA
jgi:hypothetical protein